MIEYPSLTVVVPCHDEGSAIPEFIPRLKRELNLMLRSSELSSFQIIVVDDASLDDSPALLERETGIEVIRLDRNRGYGFALKTGFAAATGDYICFMDLDGTYDPADLPPLFSAIRESGVDIVQGDRLTRREPGMSPVRWLGNSSYVMLTRLIFRQPVRDVCSGYRIFRRSLTPWLLALPQDKLNYSLSVSLAAIRGGLEVREIPIRYHPRAGRSKLSVVRDGIHFLVTLLMAAMLSVARAPSETELW